jgi:AsmA family protein
MRLWHANRISTPVRWIGGIFAGLLLMLLGLSLIDWNAARGPLSRMISRHIERPVSISGPLRVRLFSSTPSVELQGLTIGNPDWAGDGNMIELPHLHAAVVLSRLLVGRLVIETLELDDPKLSLIQDEQGRANWNFTPDSKPKEQRPSKFPPLLHFALRGGTLDIRDAVRKLIFRGTLGAIENGAGHEQQPFRLLGQGTLNKEPFKLSLEGDALLDIKLDHPYHFQSAIDAGPSSLKMKGVIAKPFDFSAIDCDIQVQGQNLANLYYLTNLALPLTPPYQLSLRVHRDGDHFALDGLDGKVGGSDLHGRGTVDLAEKDGRPKLTASVTSHSLNLHDLGVALGAGVPQSSEQKGNAPVQTPPPQQQPISPLLLPTFDFQFDRLQKMDAAIDFRADSVQAEKVPFKNVAFKLKLERGDLNIDPVDFELPEGKLTGTIHLDSKGKAPQLSMDIRLHDIHLEQFKPKNASEAPLDGTLQGRIHIEGSGSSIHAVAADANGTLSAVLPHGDMRRAFAELTGIDVVRGLGLLLSKNQQSEPIRCGVVEFQLEDGNAQARQLVFDTQDVLVTGEGHITFSDEKVDLNLKGQPKKPRFDRLRTPINVRGTLRHPSIGVSAPALAKQGAVAVALGAVATPIAAVLAFIDPGLAKNADCSGLTQQAEGDLRNPPPANQPPANPPSPAATRPAAG